MNRNPKTPFTLTASQKQVLELHRKGVRDEEIMEITGMTYPALCFTLNLAIEKDRLRILDEKDHKTKFTLLRKARGQSEKKSVPGNS